MADAVAANSTRLGLVRVTGHCLSPSAYACTTSSAAKKNAAARETPRHSLLALFILLIMSTAHASAVAAPHTALDAAPRAALNSAPINAAAAPRIISAPLIAARDGARRGGSAVEAAAAAAAAVALDQAWQRHAAADHNELDVYYDETTRTAVSEIRFGAAPLVRRKETGTTPGGSTSDQLNVVDGSASLAADGAPLAHSLRVDGVRFHQWQVLNQGLKHTAYHAITACLNPGAGENGTVTVDWADDTAWTADPGFHFDTAQAAVYAHFQLNVTREASEAMRIEFAVPPGNVGQLYARKRTVWQEQRVRLCWWQKHREDEPHCGPWSNTIMGVLPVFTEYSEIEGRLGTEHTECSK